MIVTGLLYLQLGLPACSSLKEKRSRLKPLIIRLRKEFNVSVAEVELMDVWQSAGIACIIVSNDSRFIQKALVKIPEWIEKYWPDVSVENDEISIL
ncbi:MAG: DUF503 domain-containing protein [Anaerolineales bacterium]|nr:DUF503 domain-containing protein [Anaerolineales bacterium]